LRELGELLFVLMAMLRRDELAEISTRGLARAAAKHLFGRRIEQQNALLFVERDDRVHRGSHERLQPSVHRSEPLELALH
jgi:hypothetical protein